MLPRFPLGPGYEGGGPALPGLGLPAQLKAYADRMQADYVRYRLAKESADSFYSRLAVFHNTFSPFKYYLNPFTLRPFGGPPPGPPGPPGPPAPGPVSPELPPVDLPATFLPTISKPPFHFPASSPLYSPDTGPGAKRRHGEDAEDKKARLCPGAKRRPGKKTAAVNDETSSPVSGTVIRQLGEGEALPEIRKGEYLSHVHSCHGEIMNGEMCVVASSQSTYMYLASGALVLHSANTGHVSLCHAEAGLVSHVALMMSS